MKLHRHCHKSKRRADDAVFYAPNGAVIRGKPAIGQFYNKFLKSITPINRIGRISLDRQSNVCALEIETRVILTPEGKWKPDPSGDFQRTVVDLFTVNTQGKVQEMRVYLAPMPLKADK
ncbi:hypothetical protein NUH86_17690 [Sphingobium sp. JS3065]|uniref:hypothetical protein n=1 Tax=Sphingobium sp. JS3065 TaxID=2970925 RepID=UPI0022655BA1|nr:hypothetical protein [Sphingobium sp. JS3065]UZW57422.1 hypothetical protein NUH86_17690 [Sphingobium sp. JS3065]